MSGVVSYCRRGCSLAIPLYGQCKCLIPNRGRPWRQLSCIGRATTDKADDQSGFREDLNTRENYEIKTASVAAADGFGGRIQVSGVESAPFEEQGAGAGRDASDFHRDADGRAGRGGPADAGNRELDGDAGRAGAAGGRNFQQAGRLEALDLDARRGPPWDFPDLGRRRPRGGGGCVPFTGDFFVFVDGCDRDGSHGTNGRFIFWPEIPDASPRLWKPRSKCPMPLIWDPTADRRAGDVA
jgi:hypothetical protein